MPPTVSPCTILVLMTVFIILYYSDLLACLNFHTLPASTWALDGKDRVLFTMVSLAPSRAHRKHSLYGSWTNGSGINIFTPWSTYDGKCKGDSAERVSLLRFSGTRADKRRLETLSSKPGVNFVRERTMPSFAHFYILCNTGSSATANVTEVCSTRDRQNKEKLTSVWHYPERSVTHESLSWE